MRTIDKYVFKAFLSSFLLAFLVLSFVLTIGLLVQIVNFILQGVEPKLVGKFCFVSLPETLQWSMPLALLVSSVLVFSRLSADSEIAAMKACGINLYSVMKWPVLFAAFCTCIGFLINNEIVPRGHEVRRSLKSEVSVGAGLSVLEPGRVIKDFPRVHIFFSSKQDGWLKDLMVVDYSDPDVPRTITASKARVEQNGTDVTFDLYNMTIDPLDKDHPSMSRMGRFPYTMKDVIKSKNYTRKVKDLRTFEIFQTSARMTKEIEELKLKEKEFAEKLAKSHDLSDDEKERLEQERKRLEMSRKANRSDKTELWVEFNKRLVFAMASICFVLIGIPLGIRSQRKESSIGMAISLAVALGYYMVIILMLSLEKYSKIHPEFIIWLPVIVCFALAAKFTRKHL